MRNPAYIPLFDDETIASFPRPDFSLMDRVTKEVASRRAAALTEILEGARIGPTAKRYKLCAKTLRHMVAGVNCLAPDGQIFGYRVAIPRAGQRRKRGQVVNADDPPLKSGPNAFGSLLSRYPSLMSLVDAYKKALPPKHRAPHSFENLFRKFTDECRKLNLQGHYPLAQSDRGRRALLRFIRRRNVLDYVQHALVAQEDRPLTTLADIMAPALFDRFEFDAHRIDVESKIGIKLPSGGVVKKPVSTIWLLALIEVKSRAIVGWLLRIGESYDNLDVALCLARCLEAWTPWQLTVPGLEYAVGAGMPSGLSAYAAARATIVAMDNAKAHHAHDMQSAFCRSFDGVLNTGVAHSPRSRPVIEQFFSRMERGAFRKIPGGFEPAKRLGGDKIRISNFSPDDYPIQAHWFEELFEVLITGYNATAHPELGNLSPLQYLKLNAEENPDAWLCESSDNEACAAEMSSKWMEVTVRGDKSNGSVPHVNYCYVKYRSNALDDAWDLIGTRVYAKVNRSDLRILTLYRAIDKPYGTVRAISPWRNTRHSETTRSIIHRWSKLGKINIAGSDDAIDAYRNALRGLCLTDSSAPGELARLQLTQPELDRVQILSVVPESPARKYNHWPSLDEGFES